MVFRHTPHITSENSTESDQESQEGYLRTLLQNLSALSTSAAARNIRGERANLKVEATKIGKIYLQGDIWTLAPGAQRKETPFRGLVMDVANVPTQSWNIKTVAVKAVLTIQSRSYSPLP